LIDRILLLNDKKLALYRHGEKISKVYAARREQETILEILDK
jgi:hypothetical protein